MISNGFFMNYTLNKKLAIFNSKLNELTDERLQELLNGHIFMSFVMKMNIITPVKIIKKELLQIK